MKKLCLTLALIFLGGIFLLTACSSQSEEESKTPEELSVQLIDEILAEDFSTVWSMGSDELKNAITEEELLASWQTTIATAGAFIEKVNVATEKADGYTLVINYLKYENTGVKITLTFGEKNVIEGIHINYYTLEDATAKLPETLTESSFTVSTGGYTMPALLTTKEENTKDSVLLLVHGSGPNDMNETIMGSAPFRDIAWGVAQHGIDVFRYDKRTFVYSENLALAGDAYLTANEEVIEDALSAAKLLSEEGYENIYLAGHSLGGLLGARIISEEPELFAGFISLAGSPRTLSEIQLSQNLAMLETLKGDQKTQAEAIIEAEQAKLASLDTFTDEELLTTTIFGISAYYVKDLYAYDTMELAKNLDIPMLFLQGSEDFQVTVEEDFNLWQAGLQNKENVSFQLYQGLTHLFTPSPENATHTITDYAAKANVDEAVITDIYEFINGNKS